MLEKNRKTRAPKQWTRPFRQSNNQKNRERGGGEGGCKAGASTK